MLGVQSSRASMRVHVGAMRYPSSWKAHCACVTKAACISELHRGPQRRQRPIAVLHIRAAAAGYAAEPQIVPSQLPKPSAPPAKLPTPPKSGSLLDVVPYLSRLAVSDKQLYWRLAASLTFMIVSKAAGLMAPIFMKQSVDALSGTITQLAVQASVLALLWSGACRVVNSVAREAQGPIFTPVAQAAGRRVAYHTFWHVLDLDLTFHLERRTGALSRILERGTRSVSMVFRAVVFTFIPTAVELVLVCALLGKIFTPLVALVVVATFVAYVLWTAQLTQAAAKSRKEVNELDNLTTGKAVDALLNYETVKLFNNEKREVDAYDSLLVGYQKAAVNTEAIASVLNAGQGAILAVGLTGVLALAAATSPVGSFTAGDLVMAQGLLTQLWGPLQFLGWFYRELRQSLVDMEAFFKILQTVPLLPDGSKLLPAYEDHARLHDRAASGVSAGPSGRGLLLELEDVRFGYDPKRPVLKGVTLTVERGKSCAIVGSSGSGKSTLLRILMRLYDVQSGSVRLEGIDVRELRQGSLRSAVAVVPQETVLFNDTILANIAYGRPDASREEIVQAAELAQLTKTIERMPDGFDTLVGERGLKLSGGERQRMAIARAFLRQPRLLICDEASSALDSNTEREIMESLESLAEGRTSIFVAHRLSTISGCDKIIVMSGGVIVEEGSHEELLAMNGAYSDMWKTQSAASQRHELCQPMPMIAPNQPVAA